MRAVSSDTAGSDGDPSGASGPAEDLTVATVLQGSHRLKHRSTCIIRTSA